VRVHSASFRTSMCPLGQIPNLTEMLGWEQYFQGQKTKNSNFICIFGKLLSGWCQHFYRGSTMIGPSWMVSENGRLWPSWIS